MWSARRPTLAIAGSDWRQPAGYTRLLPGDRRCFAWEWLRRTPDYVAASTAGRSPRPFGLVRLEHPGRDAMHARPVWNAAIDRAVLQADTAPDNGGDQLDLTGLGLLTSVISTADPSVRHLLVSDGLRSVRVDIRGAESLLQPIVPIWRIEGLHDIAAQLTALAQLSAFVRTGRFSRALHRPERRARRWIDVLRVHDALACGALHREIVAGLFEIDVSESYWRAGRGDSLRLRVHRLAAAARACLATGPRGWLA